MNVCPVRVCVCDDHASMSALPVDAERSNRDF